MRSDDSLIHVRLGSGLGQENLSHWTSYTVLITFKLQVSREPSTHGEDG